MIIGFDWDGTLVQRGISAPLPGARERLAALPAGTRTFIATNQAGVAHSYYTEQHAWPSGPEPH